jgi:hypothetical protein
MAIFRGSLPADDFAIVANHWFRDPRLSGKAKGYMGYIATHSPQYRLTIDQMIAEMREGRDAVYAGLEELVGLDYLVRTQSRDGGQFGEVDYHFGPAAYEATFDRAWPRASSQSPGSRTASGKAVSGHDQGKRDDIPGRTASGKAASGKAASGESASKKNTSSKKIKGLEDQEKTPPTPRDAEPPAPAVDQADPGGDSSASPETAPTDDTSAPLSALDRLVVELATAGSWDADVVRDVLVDLADRGIDRAEIARVFREVAAGDHGPTRSPRRLLTWWPSPKTAANAPAEPYKHKPAPPCVDGCECWKHQGEPGSGPGVSNRAAAALAAVRATLPAGKPLWRRNDAPAAADLPSRRLAAEIASQAADGADSAA